jgi:hypothetical protein
MAASDRAQYAIEIAAQMTGGAQTTEQLDALTDKLLAGGKDAAYFKDAIAQVTNELESVASSVTAANNALSDGKARYRELEKAADMSAKAAERAALKHGGVVPVELYQAAEQAKRALEGEANVLRQLEVAAANASGKHDVLKTKLSNLNTLSKHVNTRLGAAAQSTSKLAGALGDLGGPLGSVGQRVIGPIKGFIELKESFGAATAASIAAAAAVALVTVAMIAGAGAAAAYGISLANQARNAQLAREAFAATSEEAAASVAVWAQVTDATGLSADRLRDLTKTLKAANVSAEDIPAALKAAATAEAALGQGGADQFVEQMKDAKASVQDVASEVEKKFGGIVARKMLGLEAQGARLQNNLSKTFGGLDIEPLLSGLTILVDLFDENTASGKALKFLFETLIQPIVDAITDAIPLIEAFWLGFLIGVMKLYIAIKPLINAVSDMLGFDDETSAETFKTFTKAGEILAYVVAALGAAFIVFALSVIPSLIASLASLIATAAVAAAPFLLIAAAVAALVYAVVKFGPQLLDAVLGFVAPIVDIGTQIMQGLARGILNGAKFVVDAISGAVNSAINTAKKLLGIASPSKLFAEIGGFTAEGFAVGVEDETPAAQAAMTEMVEPPAAATESALSGMTSPVDRAVAMQESSAASPAAASQGSASVSLSGVTININGVENAEDAASKFRDLLLQMMNGTLTQAGGAA